VKVGITGTRQPITTAQSSTLQLLILTMQASELHHGDCKGADATAHALVTGRRQTREFSKMSRIKLVVHPPDDDRWRAFCQDWDEIWKPTGYLSRNEDIVSAADLLIAIPRLATEELISGTWSTVRYARSTGKPIMIIDPDGGWRMDTTHT
jgi:hypothetical protein